MRGPATQRLTLAHWGWGSHAPEERLRPLLAVDVAGYFRPASVARWLFLPPVPGGVSPDLLPRKSRSAPGSDAYGILESHLRFGGLLSGAAVPKLSRRFRPIRYRNGRWPPVMWQPPDAENPGISSRGFVDLDSYAAI